MSTLSLCHSTRSIRRLSIVLRNTKGSMRHTWPLSLYAANCSSRTFESVVFFFIIIITTTSLERTDACILTPTCGQQLPDRQRTTRNARTTCCVTALRYARTLRESVATRRATRGGNDNGNRTTRTNETT